MLFADTFRAFRHRDYFIYWCGLFLGHTGTLIQTTAQSWLIFQLTGSTFYLGLEGFCLAVAITQQAAANRFNEIERRDRAKRPRGVAV